MKLNKIMNLFIALGLLSFFVISCEKNDVTSPVISTAEDDVLAELIYEDIFSEVDAALMETETTLYGGKKSADAVVCKVITVEYPSDTVTWPRTITIDYGEGCTGPNGVVRKGRIITTINKGRFWLAGFTRVVTFDNYYIDELKIEGTKTFTNTGKNDNGNIVFHVTLEGGKVIHPDGKEILREFEHEKEWVSGAATPRVRIDDEFMITGSATGVDRKGRAFSRTILTPLHRKVACRWIVAGSIELQTEGMPTAILDYGDGECDRKATVTAGEEIREILLRR